MSPIFHCLLKHISFLREGKCKIRIRFNGIAKNIRFAILTESIVLTFYFYFYSLADSVSNRVVLNSTTINLPALPTSAMDTRNSQGNPNVSYEDVIEQTNAGSNYILSKCPAYETLNLPTKHRVKIVPL